MRDNILDNSAALVIDLYIYFAEIGQEA